MNFDLNTAPLLSDHPVQRCRHPLQDGVAGAPLEMLFDNKAGISLKPPTVEVFGHHPELNDEIPR